MFWQRFYDLCIQKGIKPNPLAQKLGISSGVISKWKNENTLPNGENLVKIADYLDVSVDYLLGRSAALQFTATALVNQLRLKPRKRETMRRIGCPLCRKVTYLDPSKSNFYHGYILSQNFGIVNSFS